MAYSPVMTRQYYDELQSGKSAMWLGGDGNDTPVAVFGHETMALASKLALDLPGFDWTIELDLLGHHRITIHFKGGSIAIDE